MDAISQTTFSNALSWMKMFEFRLKFHWNLFPRVQLTIFQHWFRWWLGAVQATSHYLNQRWLVYRRIYASLGLNELKTCSDYWRKLTNLQSNKTTRPLLCKVDKCLTMIWRFSASPATKLICHAEYQWLPHTRVMVFSQKKMNKFDQLINSPTVITLYNYFT